MDKKSTQEILFKIDQLSENLRIHNLTKKEFLNITETSKYFNITINHIYDLTRRKKIPFYKPNGKSLYFKIEELEEFIRKGKIKTKEEIDDMTNDFLGDYKK